MSFLIRFFFVCVCFLFSFNFNNFVNKMCIFNVDIVFMSVLVILHKIKLS